MSERRRASLVTIADLYGTGGSVIGTRVAERLEVPLPDHVIPEEAARRTGVSEDAIADGDEEPRSRVDRLFSVVARDDGHQAPDKYRTTSITRSAACGARSRKPWPRRRGRAAWRSDAQGSGLVGIERDAARQRLEREDKARIDYVLRAYGVQGLDPELNHLMRDSTAVPLDTCVELIAAAARAHPDSPGNRPDVGEQMLAPRDTPTRERKSLNGLWRFALDPDGDGRARNWPGGLPREAREVPVPASYNDIFTDPEVHDHVGEVWYETTVRVPSGWAGQRIMLRFGSATHRATVWVDGQEVVEHEGGFTPFEAEVTDLVEPGGEHRITAVVDSVLRWDTIPPGYVAETPDGPRQHLLFDFFNYAGLHRTVWLYSTPLSYVADVSVVTGLDGPRGTVSYDVDAVDAQDLTVKVTLRDAEGAEVAVAEGDTGEIAVADVRPWRPGEGYLYQLSVELWRDDARPGDSYTLPVGVRTVEVRGQRFLINGEPFYFRGFGRHEDTPVRGKGHDDVFMVHDFALMEWLGANSFRTSHYPYAEEVLEYADRHGIVVIDEAPGVGINSGLAAGVFGATPFTTFSPDTISEATQRSHERVIRELVERDKNHPCVVMWSIANEPESVTQESREYFAPLVNLARQLDPSRPVAFANVPGADADKDMITDLFDVIMLNRYYGWYMDAGDLAAAERALEANLTAWQDKYDKPIIMTEYGADTLSGMHGIFPGPWTEEYQVVLLEMSHRVFDRIDAIVGEQVWNFADFAVAPGILRAGGMNRKGIFTRGREPKSAADTLRRRWRA